MEKKDLKLSHKKEVAEFVDQVPKVQGNDPADYQQLKKELIGFLNLFVNFKFFTIKNVYTEKCLIQAQYLNTEYTKQMTLNHYLEEYWFIILNSNWKIQNKSFKI